MLEGFERVQILAGSSFLSITDNGLNFNNNAVKRMDNAPYVVLMINRDAKKIAIQKCEEHDADSIPFYRDEINRRNGVRFSNREAQQIIASMMGWDLYKHNYRVDGVYYPDINAMIFDLNMAREFGKRNKGSVET